MLNLPKFPIDQNLSILRERLMLIENSTSYIVGGAVRDHILGIQSKDIDIEVFGVDIDDLENLLSQYFKVNAVGKSFGVLSVRVSDNHEPFDVSVPRKETKTSNGHTGFEIEYPNMTFKEASRRRDFTMNAIGINLETGEYHDPYNGINDIHNKIIKHVSDQFSEDPLRVLRACQFASRFDFHIYPETKEICKQVTKSDEFQQLSQERIGCEFDKLLMKGFKPSVGLDYMLELGALVLFPDLEAMVGIPQHPKWHPEGQDDPRGSLWVHMGLVVDQAAKIVRRDNLNREDALVVLYGSLCHDLGKPSTTRFEDGKIISKDHEEAGEEPTRNLLQQIRCADMRDSMIDTIVAIVKDHLKPSTLYAANSKKSAIRRLSLRAPINLLVKVSEADFRGRGENAVPFDEPYPAGDWLLDKANNLGVQKSGPARILMGRHLIEMGVEPGLRMGQILDLAFEAQLDGQFETLDEAKIWIETHIFGDSK